MRPFTCRSIRAFPAPKDIAHGILVYAELSFTHQTLDVPAAQTVIIGSHVHGDEHTKVPLLTAQHACLLAFISCSVNIKRVTAGFGSSL